MEIRTMLKNVSITLLFLFTFFNQAFPQDHGLHFKGHEYKLDQRTGLELPENSFLKVKNQFDLSFELKFYPSQTKTNFGYIFRVMIDGKNIDLNHAASLDKPNNFTLVIGDEMSDIQFTVPVSQLEQNWVKFRFRFDLTDQKIYCYLNDTTLVTQNPDIDTHKDVKLFFGKHSYQNYLSTDVPEMGIRNIEIWSKNKLTHSWGLNEIKGDIAHDKIGSLNGKVTNPDWLLNSNYFWKNKLTIHVPGKANTAYDEKNDKFYIDSDNYLQIINTQNWQSEKIMGIPNHKIKPAFDLIFDTLNNELYEYSIRYGEKNTFDYENNEWLNESQENSGFSSTHIHHNRFISDGQLFVFGGYGGHKYRNTLYAFDDSLNRFKPIDYTGDFHPRYMAGGAFNRNDSLYYILGGYGSKSGEQGINPHYYFELLTYSQEKRNFEIFHTFDDGPDEFCFGTSMIIHNNYLYALLFSKYVFNNQLQLVKIPLDNPEVIPVGDKIAFKFNDVNSIANLYINKKTNSLIAITSYSDTEETTISLYTLSFPPISLTETYAEISEAKKLGAMNTVLIIGSFILLLILLLLLFIRRKKRKNSKAEKENSPVAIPEQKIADKEPANEMGKVTPLKNAILLFGGFQVFDKDGKDITNLFTPLLKSLFIYILLNTIRNDKGVSFNNLYETFWSDKTNTSARNNRAVNIGKLRSILASVGATDITKETGYWKLKFDPETIYIDYLDYTQLATHKKNPTKDEIKRLINISRKGSFLYHINDGWSDSFKSEVANNIIDCLLNYVQAHKDEDPDFSIELTNCIFSVDAVSEEAMIIQCKLFTKLGKHSLAKKTYTRFVKEYTMLYGESYDKSFNDIFMAE